VIYLLLGLIIFFGVHAVRMLAPGYRLGQIEALGEGPWKGMYSAASIAGLALIIWGWMHFREYAPDIYFPPDWSRHIAAMLVLFASILIFAAYLPTGRIKAAVGHPFLLAVILWSIAHLVANGDLASVLVFGSFLIYAVWNRIAVAGRPEPAPVFVSVRGDILAIVMGLLAYVIFALWIHSWLFGVAPMG